MPLYHRTYSPGELQFITTSTYRRAPLFLSQRFCRCFVQRLEEVREEMKFLPIGWVLMPDHFHLLVKPQPAETTPLILKGLKEETAERILETLRRNPQHPWCRKMLARLRLPPTVHDESHYRLWQRRFFPFNVYSEKKRRDKLDYMHNNPVKHGLVKAPGDWPWSCRGGEVLLPAGYVDSSHGPAMLNRALGGIPSGNRRAQTAGSAPARRLY
jgi:putative transposase